MHRSLSLQVGALALVALVALPARAQDPGFTLAPSAGLFLPGTDLIDGEVLGSARFATVRHQVGPTLGLRVSRRLGMRLAIEAEGLLALSDIELEPESAEEDVLTRNAHLFAMAVEARYDIYRVPFSPFSTHLLGGIGLVARGGEFFDDGANALEGPDGGADFAALIGAGFRYGLDPIVALRLDIRDFISSYQPRFEGTTQDSKSQHDIWMSLALEFRV